MLDVNVVANYDEAIISLLDEPVGAEFEVRMGCFWMQTNNLLGQTCDRKDLLSQV